MSHFAARVTLGFGLFVFASLTQADTSVPLPVRLTAPEADSVLVAGSQVTLGWELVAAGFESIDGPIEEWEAFVSVNGGRTYPFRVTPHLDLDLSSFSVPVPEVQSADVRILLRFGNERHEVGFELPQRFSIAAPGPMTPPTPPRLASPNTIARGEAARPGDAGVFEWIDGTRRGRDLSRRAAADDSRLHGSRMEASRLLILASIPPRRHEIGARVMTARRTSTVQTSVDRRDSHGCLARSLAVLLLIQRSNR